MLPASSEQCSASSSTESAAEASDASDAVSDTSEKSEHPSVSISSRTNGLPVQMYAGKEAGRDWRLLASGAGLSSIDMKVFLTTTPMSARYAGEERSTLAVSQCPGGE